MQHELDKLLVSRRRRRRWVAIVLILFVIAATLVLARSCTSQFSEPYNKSYTPMDTPQAGSGSRR